MRPSYLTLTTAKALLRPLGVTVRKRDGEYRVAFDMRDSEPSAYYTTDLADALETGRDMARRRSEASGRLPLCPTGDCRWGAWCAACATVVA